MVASPEKMAEVCIQCFFCGPSVRCGCVWGCFSLDF